MNETTHAVSDTRPGGLIGFNLRLRDFLTVVGHWGSYFILPLIVITIFDVTIRKLIWIQLWLIDHFGAPFESTTLQELEWHFHTIVFCMVLGYGYVQNRMVRVDLIRETLAFRKQAWIEFLGVTVFMLPYCIFLVYFGAKFAYDSYTTNEISASMVGLGYRWIIKTVFVVGLILAVLSGIAVWLETAILLFGRTTQRFDLMTLDWPGEEGNRRIGIYDDVAPTDKPPDP